MKQRIHPGWVIPAILLTAGVVGCDRKEPQTERLGERVDNATKQMVEVVDDAALTAKVKAAIAADPGLGEALEIDIDTQDGVVTLTGSVDSPEEIERAALAARGVAGVRMVTNRLTLNSENAAGDAGTIRQPPAGGDAFLDTDALAPAPAQDTASGAALLDDAALTARVKTALASEPGLAEAMQIDVDTIDGTVPLSGTVESQSASEQALDVARRVQGVRDVKNRLVLRSPS